MKSGNTFDSDSEKVLIFPGKESVASVKIVDKSSVPSIKDLTFEADLDEVLKKLQVEVQHSAQVPTDFYFYDEDSTDLVTKALFMLGIPKPVAVKLAAVFGFGVLIYLYKMRSLRSNLFTAFLLACSASMARFLQLEDDKKTRL